MVDGGIVTALKVSVSRQQYRQVVKTFSNLSVPNNEQSADQPTKSKEGPGATTTSVPRRGPEGGQTVNARHSPTVAVKETSAETQQRPLQSGFMPGKSTTDRILALHVLVERRWSFSVPSMCVELRGDVGEREKPLVNLLLEEIKVTYESCEPYKDSIQVTLRSLMMEDLQQSDDCAEHKFLMTSHTDPMDTSPEDSSLGNRLFNFDRQIPKFISTSCPEPHQHHGPDLLPSSLPSKFRMEKPFFKAQQKPAPSSSPAWKSVRVIFDESLDVLVMALEALHEETKPLGLEVSWLKTKVQTHRFIDVDFNSLNTIINISSWVMVLDFFSTDEDEANPSTASRDQAPNADISRVVTPPAIDEFNSIVEVQVRLLGLTLIKAGRPLARASISQVVVRSVGSDGNLTLNGRLGSLSLVDCSSHSRLYPEKFITTGNEAMTFQLFKYGHDDPEMQRVCDVRLKLKMSSVMYLHTHRFASEITQFVQEFNQLRDIVSRWRATTAGLKGEQLWELTGERELSG
ncbi:Vacuolar protein sorting-associated protein 13D [Chionoecetes opilio]|uniref:Vacuolar protein sorting-associated protein 13D n=1 Tax=Chionoecetes opilio TaxID=41210 RepID=A0A8J8WD41_CHIOP|nr:Vacuolar protein sorting-associated protein 13D [Chionoecetes opilio]